MLEQCNIMGISAYPYVRVLVSSLCYWYQIVLALFQHQYDLLHRLFPRMSLMNYVIRDKQRFMDSYTNIRKKTNLLLSHL